MNKRGSGWMVGSCRGSIVVALAVMCVLPLGPFSGNLSEAREVTSFSDGSPEGIVELRPPSANSGLSLRLPEYCYVVESGFEVSTHASGDPRSPAGITLDVDGDGTVEWEFNGTGVGAFGHQDRTVNGSLSVSLRFPLPGSQSFTLRLPRGAVVSNASFNVTGELGDLGFKPLKATGARAYDMFGLSVAGAGDLNRDGYDDVVVGAPGGDTKGFTDNGYATVYYGTQDGFQVAAGDTVAGNDDRELLGFAVAGVGDFTGDGLGEILAGAPSATYRGMGPTPTPNTGVAYLYPYDSSIGRLRSLPARALPGVSTGGQMGFAVSEIPDLDKDGRGDIAGGEIMANRTGLQPYFGRAAALRSSDPGSIPTNYWGEHPYSFFGSFIARARDLDSDGKPDFIIGAKLNGDGAGNGSAYVYLSKSDFKTPLVFKGNQYLSNFSASGTSGDFNGDGFGDLALGAPNMSLGNRETGAVLIYWGGPKGLDPSSKPAILWGRSAGSSYGFSVACPGDVDLDGTDDLVIGSPSAVPDTGIQPTGLAELVLTGRNRTIPIWGESPHENFGWCVAAAGDLNRDGFRDFIIGAPTSSAGNLDAAGRAVVCLSQIAAPRNPRINVGGAGDDDWSYCGTYARTTRIPDFSDKLNGILSNPLPAVIDGYGNEFNDVPVVVHSDKPGQLTISNISITYNWTAQVDINPDPATGNLTWVLNNILGHKRTDPPDRVIPLVFNASTPGSVRVHGLSIIIDEAPVARPTPAVALPEDGSDAHLLDLYTLFWDDFQPDDLLFTIDAWTNDTRVVVDLTEWRWLSVDAYNGTGNDNWTGEVRVTVSAMDDSGLYNTTNITVAVTPVDDPPAITSSPPLTARAGSVYSYTVLAVDAENGTLSFGLAGGPDGMRLDRSSGLLEWIPSEAQYNKTHAVTLWASDGRLCATQSFAVAVDSRLEGARITTAPPPTAVAGEEYVYLAGGTTDVPNATLAYSLTSGPPGLTLLPNGTMRWVPPASQIGRFEVAIAASDGYFTARQAWNLTVLPAGTPLSGVLCGIREPAEGARVSGTVTVRGFANITVGSVALVEIQVDQGGWKPANGTLDWSLALDTTQLSNGRHVIYARAFDGSSHSLAVNISVEIDNPAPAGEALLSSPLLWAAVLFVAVLAAAIPLGLYLGRKRAASGARAPPAAAPPAVAPAGGEEPIAVEDLFLIHIDGRLIHHATRRLATGVDSDILSSMLTAVTSFVKDALARTGDGTLGSLEYGENKIILERGRWVYLAVVITGRQEPRELRDEMKQVVRNIESEYAAVLPGWDGNASPLAGCKKLLAPLTAFTLAAPAPEPAGPAQVDVGLTSELEFYQGYVRLKVAIKNNSRSFIMDAALRIIHNDKALKLDHIEPEYPLSGREIMLGNIGIREKKTVALYLDPQICMESHIEGTLTFKDAQGELHHADMKRKLASVVCPIMYTDENINVPMLRRMLEGELDQKDSKVFSLPAGLGPEPAFELCKRAVQGHDIRLVRDFVDRDPFVGEAWYFGKVKGRPDRLVVKTAVRADTKSAEFYVASNSRLVVTGLLAELKNDLNNEYKKDKGAEKPLETLEDGDRRERVRTAGSLLDKYAQGEAAPGTTRPPEMAR